MKIKDKTKDTLLTVFAILMFTIATSIAVNCYADYRVKKAIESYEKTTTTTEIIKFK